MSNELGILKVTNDGENGNALLCKQNYNLRRRHSYKKTVNRNIDYFEEELKF